MKLTKVLVGLLAISLCGVAAAAVKKGMAPEDLRAGFIKAVKGEKTTEATEFINALKARGDWDYYYRTMIKADLKEMANGTALIEKYIGKVEAKKIEPVKDLTKPGEDTTKPPVTGAWPTDKWGSAPDLTSDEAIDKACGDDGAFGKVFVQKASMTQADKDLYNSWIEKAYAAAKSDVVKQGMDFLKIK